MPARPQERWNIKNNNAELVCPPDQQQINNIYHFCHNLSQYYNHFLMLSYQIAPNAFLSDLQLVTDGTIFDKIIEQINEKGYVFIDTISDFCISYKGWVSWVMICFNNKGYLIDGLALNGQLKKMKGIMENPQIVKYCYRGGVVLEDSKRDWGAFGMNFFDFQMFQKSIGVKKGMNIIRGRLSQRPIQNDLMQQLQQRYDNMIKYLAQIRYFLQNQSKDYPLYVYANHYELLLKEYHHLSLTLSLEQKQFLYIEAQKRRRQREQKQNNSQQNQQNIIQSQFPQFKGDVLITNQRERGLCELLIQWREHMAKIMDCPVRQVLTFHQILTIAMDRPTSILQIQEILSGDRLLSFELASKVLQILTLQSQLQQNQANQLQVRNSRKGKQDKNIKSLLAQLKWQGRQQWLNRKNDESIRLYKQLVSIVELDDSVIQQFLKGMNKGVVSKAEISRFVKYAEYMRNGNHRRLKEHYENSVPLDCGQQLYDEMDGWNSEEQDFITGRNSSNSLTSIAGSCERLPEKGENSTSVTLRMPNSIDSFTSEAQIAYHRIEPLPESIEQIYLKAVTVKKGYQKVQKKKGNKKDGKQDCEQFVPSWQQIKALLNANE